MDLQSFKLKSNYIRHQILDMVYNAKSGHIGGSFSATELLVVLFYQFLKYDIQNLEDETRDYFVLSKGHITPVYYSILADLGFFPETWLESFRKIDAPLQGHPKLGVPGIEVSTGSLGQGLGNAAGLALGLKLANKSNAVISLLGDGELQEGVVWETFMAIAHLQLTNLLIIVDYNGYQTDGAVSDIMSIDPVADKFHAFGFDVSVIDGHDIMSIQNIYQKFYTSYLTAGKPMVIIAKTLKGKGVSFMENTAAWHGKPPTEAQYLAAKQELLENKD